MVVNAVADSHGISGKKTLVHIQSLCARVFFVYIQADLLVAMLFGKLRRNFHQAAGNSLAPVTRRHGQGIDVPFALFSFFIGKISVVKGRPTLAMYFSKRRR